MSRVRLADILLLGAAFAALYFVLRSAGQTPDGLSYAVAVRDGVDLYHPHHLLYGPVTRFLFQLTGARDAILAGVLHNLAWLVALAWGAWRLAGRLGWSHGAALLAAVTLLSSRGVLFYSTHVETYLPALACLTLLTAHWFAPRRSDLEAAAWLALAVLYHQTNVLVIVPLLVTSSRWRRDFLRVVLPAGLCILALYILAWRWSPTEAGFVPWVLTYVQADVPAWGALSHFSPTGLAAMGLNQLRMILPVPETSAVAGAGVLLIGVVLLAGYHLRRSEQRRERRFALVYLGVYLLFFLWWIPSDPDFFLATLLPLWWLGLRLVGDLAPRWRGRWWILPVLMLLTGNLWFTARPMNADPGPLHARAQVLHHGLAPDVALVVGYGLEQELRYYTDRRDIYEGDALALDVSAGRTTPRNQIVVEQEYLRLLLQRRSDRDLRLLRSLLAFDPAGPAARITHELPDGLGLLIATDRTPVAAWPELLAQLTARHGATPD